MKYKVVRTIQISMEVAAHNEVQAKQEIHRAAAVSIQSQLTEPNKRISVEDNVYAEELPLW